MTPDRTQTKRKYTKSDMLRDFLKGSVPYFILGTVFALSASAADMVRPRIVEFAIDQVLGGAPAEGVFAKTCERLLGNSDKLLNNLWLLALAVILCSGAALLLRYFYQLSTVKAGEIFVKRMRDLIFSHILMLPDAWQSSRQTGDIIQRCTYDVEEVKNFLSDQLVTLISMCITIIMTIFFMIPVSIPLTLVAVSALPLITGFSLWFHKKVSAAFLDCDEQEGYLSTIAQENLTGIRVVRAFGGEAREQERFHKQNHVVTEKWIDLGKYLSFFWCFADFMTGVIMLTLLSLGSFLCVKGSLTVGGLLAMVSYLALFMRPVRGLGRVLSEFSKTSVSLQRLYEIMEAEPEQDAPGADEPPLTGDIEFDHVTFSYQNAEPVLRDVSFRIPAGTTLGILGSTGSGKTTIASLLADLLPLPEGCGSIRIGGRDLRTMKASHVRKQVGYVLQEPFLFSRTLYDNISLAVPDAPPSLVAEAAGHACLIETISGFQKGFDTFVGERGVTLSGGQKQRAAIARTLTLKTPILIFDDSLSAVDAETDALIRKNLALYQKQATVILISHRIATLMAADQILVLEDGSVADRGTHEELKQKPGLYRKICDIQQGKEAPDGK